MYQRNYAQLDGSIFHGVAPTLKLGPLGANLLVGNETRKPPCKGVDADRRIARVLRAKS